jgi:methylamine utilization protein MauE
MRRSERILKIVVALTFATAGVLKVLHPAEFALSLARFRMIPPGMLGALAIVLPWVEIVAAVALFVPNYREAALRTLMALLGAFTAFLVTAIALGTAVSCGCYGTAGALNNRPGIGVLRNVCLMILVFVLIRLHRKPTSPAAPASTASGTGR